MSGLKVPVFFGSILTLVVIVLQNRTPTYQLMLLGAQFRPLPLGLLVAGAGLSGLFLGAILQRTGRRPHPEARSRSASREVSSPPGFQTFRTIPRTPDSDDPETDEFDFNQPADREFTTSPETLTEETSSTRPSTTKGWDTGVSSSWVEDAKEQESRSFWSRPAKGQSRRKRTGFGSVTPINPNLNSSKASNAGNGEASDPAVVDAEYRIVTPYQREETDEFDDEFFDDFFEEEQS